MFLFVDGKLLESRDGKVMSFHNTETISIRFSLKIIGNISAESFTIRAGGGERSITLTCRKNIQVSVVWLMLSLKKKEITIFKIEAERYKRGMTDNPKDQLYD